MLSARKRGILTHRLHNQKLPRSSVRKPEAVVEWLGAVQAQEYPFARWGVGQRTIGSTDAEVARAFDEGRILRTHIMRPTWHFVSPKDIRWMQMLTGPRVHAGSNAQYRNLGLDAALFARCAKILERALRGGCHLTRTELGEALARGGIAAKGQLLAYVMMWAELERLVCSGPRRGNQFTYALLEERVPPAPPLSREEALAELTRRYFTSHGPATIRDYVWWSGLTVGEAKLGVELVRPALARETLDSLTYLHARSRNVPEVTRPSAWLLPIYDEFLIAYRDRGLNVTPQHRRMTAPTDPYANLLVVNGTLAGTWRRQLTGDSVRVRVAPGGRLTPGEKCAIAAAVDRYAKFVELPVTVTIA